MRDLNNLLELQKHVHQRRTWTPSASIQPAAVLYYLHYLQNDFVPIRDRKDGVDDALHLGHSHLGEKVLCRLYIYHLFRDVCPPDNLVPPDPHRSLQVDNVKLRIRGQVQQKE